MNGISLKNRLVRSATWEGIAEPDGGLTEEAYKIYEELAKGGVGMIITGFTSVMSNDFYFDGMMRLSKDGLIPQYRKLTDLIHRENCPVLSQIALGGYYRRMPDGRYGLVEPDDMTKEEIHEVKDAFVDAAVWAEKAGLGRIRLLLEILHGIKEKTPGLHVTVKINSSDFTSGGLNEKESLIICKKCEGFRR